MRKRDGYQVTTPEPDSEVAQTARRICGQLGNDPAKLLEILHQVQGVCGYVPEDAIPVIASAINRSRAEVYGVVSFYHDFRVEPLRGDPVRICLGEACRSMGAAELMNTVNAACSRYADISEVYCLGNCALAPAAQVKGRLIGRANAPRIAAILLDEPE